MTRPVVQYTDPENTRYIVEGEHSGCALNTIANIKNPETYSAGMYYPLFPVFFCTCRFIFAWFASQHK